METGMCSFAREPEPIWPTEPDDRYEKISAPAHHTGALCEVDYRQHLLHEPAQLERLREFVVDITGPIPIVELYLQL